MCAAHSIWRALCGDAGRSRKRQTVDRLMSGAIAPHFVGQPRVGDTDQEFDPGLSTHRSGRTCQMTNRCRQVTAPVSAWGVGCGGGFRAVGVLFYEWLNGMGVVICDNALPSTA